MRWMLILVMVGCGDPVGSKECAAGEVYLSTPTFNDCVPLCAGADDTSCPGSLRCAKFSDGSWGLCHP